MSRYDFVNSATNIELAEKIERALEALGIPPGAIDSHESDDDYIGVQYKQNGEVYELSMTVSREDDWGG